MMKTMAGKQTVGGKIMKRFCFIFALFCTILFLAACGGESSKEDEAATLGGPCQIYGEETCSANGAEILICQESVWHTRKKCNLKFDEHCRQLPSGLYDCTDPETEEEEDSNEEDPASDNETTDSGFENNDDSGEDTGSDDSDSASDEGENGSDDGDSGSEDETDSQPDEDDTDTVPEPTDAEKCLDAGGTWNSTEKSCIKTVECDPIPVDHAEWNGQDSYTQKFTNGSWSDNKNPTEYSEDSGICKYKCEPDYAYENNNCINEKSVLCADKPPHTEWNGANSYISKYVNGSWEEIPTEYSSTGSGTCKYKCDSTHYWHNSECTSPCDSSPCSSVANATSCSASAWNKYKCLCQSGYYWNNSYNTSSKCINPCNSGPCNSVANATSCSASAWNKYTCGCISGYVWTGERCLSECKKFPNTPCYDTASKLTWSEISDERDPYDFYTASQYCSRLKNDNAHKIFNDWRVPTIDELKTLLTAANGGTPRTASCRVSAKNSCLAWDDCWTCSTCTEAGTQETGGTDCDSWGSSATNGKYSKLGDSSDIWSSSYESESYETEGWYIDFSRGALKTDYLPDYNEMNVRCVR